MKKILEEQSNTDSPIFIAMHDKKRDLTRIIIDGWGIDKDDLQYSQFTFQYEELEDFFFFMEKVYNETR